MERSETVGPIAETFKNETESKLLYTEEPEIPMLTAWLHTGLVNVVELVLFLRSRETDEHDEIHQRNVWPSKRKGKIHRITNSLVRDSHSSPTSLKCQ
jgi:hypothetical protein